MNKNLIRLALFLIIALIAFAYFFDMFEKSPLGR